MEPIKSSAPPKDPFFPLDRLVLGSLVVLPYLSYLGLAGLAVFLATSLWHWGSAIGRLLYRQGWVWLTLGIGLSVAVSQNPVESALQSLNFWPFFVFYGAIAVSLSQFKQPLQVLYHWALGLLLATLPITLRAIVEFYLKAPNSVARWSPQPWLGWLYHQPDYGFRADSVFGHPNVMASYLVIVFGLGLGLCAHCLNTQGRSARAYWIYGATALVLAGLYCSGSRNGLMVAGLQILCFGWLMRRYRFLVLLGLGALVSLGLGVLAWGIGGRSLAEAFSSVTLRWDVWRLAAHMVAQHPWLGNGLGSFRLQYKPYTIPIYDWVAHSHNLLLMLAAELGLPITLAFLAIVGWVVAQSLKSLITQPFAPSQQAVLLGYHMAFGGALAFAMFDLSFYDARVNVLGWLIMAAIQAIPTLARASAPRPLDQLHHPQPKIQPQSQTNHYG